MRGEGASNLCVGCVDIYIGIGNIGISALFSNIGISAIGKHFSADIADI